MFRRFWPLFMLIALALPVANATSYAAGRSRPATAKPVSSADVTITINRSAPAGTSQLSMGVTHTQRSADPWNNGQAVGAARQLLQASTTFQNQHLMGWGAENPQPAPGVYDWRSLDNRINLIRQTGGTPVLTLCCSPDWMKGGQPGSTDWSKLEVAPRPEHYADFALLAAAAVQRYPEVKYFQVWNELKGFYNGALNRWDYEGYTTLYNLVYDAVKAVRPDAKIGGPYVVMDSWGNRGTMSHPSGVSGPYGTLDQRPLDVISYWLDHKHGADFITVDAGTGNRDGVQTADEWTATQKFVDIANWIHQRTDLPLWWAEWYCTPWGSDTWDHQHQNAVMALTLLRMAQSGAAVALRWQPQGEANTAYQGNAESVWSDTGTPGGGQPFPFFYTQKTFNDSFKPGTPLFRATTSSPQVQVLAGATKTVLINTTTRALTVSVDGKGLTLAPYEVRVLG